jgi:predicted O-linked N-acetylglucosamine transferase (SPINDLY family)
MGADAGSQAFEDALAHQRAGRLSEAETACRHALERRPEHADAANLLGLLLCQSGRLAEGTQWLRRAAALDPNHPIYLTNLGNALAAGRDLDGAIGSFRRVLTLRPNLPDAWNNLGNALQEKGEVREAIAAHRRAIELRPKYATAHYNLAGAYTLAGLYDEAIGAYDQAIKLAPADAKAQVNRANLLKDTGQLDEAIAGYEQAMRVSPSSVAEGNLIYSLYFHPDYDSQRIFEHLVRWERDFAAPLSPQFVPHQNDRSTERRLRIGYVSADLSVHPVGRFLLPLLANHDHEQFEIYCYSDLRTPDGITERLRAGADVWRETFLLSDAQLAQQIRADRIDILVDLALHTAGNRLLAFARKPAPVQVTWLGYPGSTGLKTIDYRLSDPYLDPHVGSGRGSGLFEAFYAEKTVRLPDCYWCYDPLVEPMEAGPLPALGNGFVTFGCLNNFTKASGPVVDLWATIMRQTLGSRLLIVVPAGSARRRLLDRMGSLGIGSVRIEFVDRVPRQEYMTYYRRIDISLDPWPFNGGTTSFDSLWMGVPLVTLTGKTAVSCGGASILSNIGLTELIANEPSEYVGEACDLAADLNRLERLRAELRGRMERSPLMHGRRFAQSVEAAFRKMWGSASS